MLFLAKAFARASGNPNRMPADPNRVTEDATGAGILNWPLPRRINAS